MNPDNNEQNLALYNCEFLEILRHKEGFGVIKLLKKITPI
jgi:hypothetical protein